MRFEDMDVWKKSSRLSILIYQHFADTKDYGFKNQITRSSLSIPSNIAEGIERSSVKEKKNLLNYSKGSCAELRTQIYIGIEIGCIPEDVGNAWRKETEEISSMLSGFMKYLDRIP